MNQTYFKRQIKRWFSQKINASSSYQKSTFFVKAILPHYQNLLLKTLYKNVFIRILLLSIILFGVKCTALKPVSSTNKPHTSESPSHSSSDTTYKLRQDIIKFAKKYEGSKYTYGGTSPKGFDCSGFTFFVFNEFGIRLPHNSGDQSREGKKVAIQKAIAGDLLIFTNKGRINHVGLVISNDQDGLYMIHGSSSRGIVIDNVTTSSYWQPRLQSARNVLD